MEPRRRFRFLREIAQGGFGKVYLAEMITGEAFSSVVAIKLLHGRWLDNDEIVMRSRDEARLLGRIQHRNIVKVVDLTSINNQCAIVMEYLEGVDLKSAATWLKERNLSFPRHAIFEIVGAVAAALDAAYNQSPLQGGQPLHVIHRDIKPSNFIMTTEGEVKVLDFGTARANFEEREAKTQALAFGSQAYMAPERMLAEPDAPAGDIFSLGVTLYELLSLKSFGKIYLRPDKYETTLNQRMAEADAAGRPVLDLSMLPVELQAEVMEFLRSMLAYEPSHRPPAAEVVDKMELFAEQSRDTGLKRFARERVREIMSGNVVEPDPNDPLTGTVVVEDSSSFESAIPPEEQVEQVFTAPPELVEPPPPRRGDTGTRSTSGPKDQSGARSAPRDTSGARSGPRDTSGARSTSGPRDTSAARNISAPRPQESVKPPEPPPEIRAYAEPVVVPRVPPPDPRNEPRPRPPENKPPEPESPASGGMMGKLVGALVVVGLLGAVVLGGGYMAMQKMADPSKTPETPKAPEGAKMPPGSATPDFGPVAAGKGAAVLTIPVPVAGVEITSAAGLKREWDGTLNLNLRDLEPGSLRTKVTPKAGGAAQRAEFRVEAGKTCSFAFNTVKSEWEKSECR